MDDLTRRNYRLAGLLAAAFFFMLGLSIALLAFFMSAR